MNEERLRAYLNLILTLLRCPSSEALAILNVNQDLIDAGLVQTMSQLAGTLAVLGDQNTAYWLLNFASQLATTIGDSSMQLQIEADRLLQQAMQQHQTSQFKAALQSCQQALNIYQEIGNRQGEANSLGNLGNALNSLGQYQQAIEHYQQSLAIEQEIGNRDGKASSLNNLGTIFYSLGQYQKAIEHHQQCLAIMGEKGDHRGQAASLNNLGIAFHSLGQYQEAIKYHQQSLAIKEEGGDRHGQASSLNNLGIAFYSLGQYQKAIEYYQQTLTLAREIGSRHWEATSLGNLGVAFRTLGQYKVAIEYLQQTLTLAREIGDLKGEAIAWHNLGDAFCSLKEYPLTIKLYQKSLDMARNIDNAQGEATSLGSLGVALYFLGQYQEAIEYHQQSVTIKRKIADRRGEAISLGNLGIAFYSLGQYQEAMEYYHQCLIIAQEISDRYVEGTSLNNLGAALLKTGCLSEAESQLRAGVKILESLRVGLEDTHKVSIFEEQGRTYHRLQEVLVARNKTKDALEIAERGRNRALVELLIHRLSPELAGKITTTLPSLQQIQQIAKEQNSTLVEYSIIYDDFEIEGKKQTQESKLFVWIITPGGEITFHLVDLKPLWQQQNISLADLVLQARESLGVEEKQRGTTPTNNLETAQPIRYINEPFRQLHRYLIEPISNLLPSNPNAPVIFIPQGALFLIPFSALQDATGKFLIEQHTILTAPSIQVLELTGQQRQRIETIHNSSLQNQDVLVVGNPTMPTIPLTEPPETLHPLPGSEAEANAIASLLNTQAIIGDKATKVYIEKLMPKARLIHLATHGLLDDIKQLGVPGAIALAPSDNDNGFLTAGEILEMKLNAELIVLSACSSGQGKITGDGVIGLSRSLFAAGVPSVIVSLWSVGDDSTEFLMTEFYQNLQNGMNKAQALRQAILKTREDFSDDPYSWAAFTLIGEAE
jgi:CHAT domain-containing protein/Tfp pilus assembly protein PilF